MPGARQSPADFSILLTCLIWGVNFSVMKFAMESLAPLALTAVRFVIASATLWLVARWLEPRVAIPRAAGWKLAGLGVVGNTLYQLGFIIGLHQTTAGNSALLIASTPVVTALLGAALGVERVTRGIAWSMGIGTLGVVLVVVANTGGVGFSLDTLTGDLLTLSAVVCWAAYTHGVRSVGPAVSPLRAAALSILGGTPLLVLAGIPSLLVQDWSRVTPAAWGAVLYSALLSIVVSYVLWNRSLYRLGSNRTSLFGITTPLFAIAAAAVILGERPTPVQLLGAALIIGSVAGNVWAHREEGRNTREPGAASAAATASRTSDNSPDPTGGAGMRSPPRARPKT
ncbi:MAG: DMT family transporter [Bryobacteraceae bacterium]|nr:DMT family transporter [Bryobacteraceae bacterium]